MDKTEKKVLAFIAISVIIPPIIVLLCRANGISGMWLGFIIVAYASWVAFIIYDLASDYIIKSKSLGAEVLKRVIFMVIPWFAIMIGFFFVGNLLEERHVRQERISAVQEDVIDRALAIEGKLATIDSLINIYRLSDKCVSARALSDVDAIAYRGNKELFNLKRKRYNEIYDILKKEHDEYKDVSVNDLKKPKILFWFCNDSISPLKNGTLEAVFPVKDSVTVKYDDFKMEGFTDMEKVEEYIVKNYTAGGIVLWSTAMDDLRDRICDVRSARNIAFVNYEYMIIPSTNGLQFFGGAVRANLRIWNFEKEAFVDTIKVYAENTKQIRTGAMVLGNEEVQNDLMNNFYDQILYSLSVKGY